MATVLYAIGFTVCGVIALGILLWLVVMIWDPY